MRTISATTGELGNDGEDQSREVFCQEGHGAAEDGHQAGGFGVAAAGHEDDYFCVVGHVVAGAEAGGESPSSAPDCRTGWPTKTGGDVVAGEEIDFEGEEAEEFVPQAGEFSDAALAPGPDLGAHVVDAFYAQGFDSFEEIAMRNPGLVDGDDEVGVLLFYVGDGLLPGGG